MRMGLGKKEAGTGWFGGSGQDLGLEALLGPLLHELCHTGGSRWPQGSSECAHHLLLECSHCSAGLNAAVACAALKKG